MSAYKLVVVDPFENYKRGDEIYDPFIVSNILNANHDMHCYDRHVRRVVKSSIEMTLSTLNKQSCATIAPIAYVQPDASIAKEDETININLESINPDAVDIA